MATLSDLFEDTLRDIYYAEKAVRKALPKMMKKATSDDLKAAFDKHIGETEEQIARLDQVFEMLEMQPRGKKCPAIDGILEEGAELMEEHEPGATLDAAMAAAAQAVEHYEIARYGTLVAWASELEMDEAAALLTQTLQQEEVTDEALADLAITKLNPAANGAQSPSDEVAEMKPKTTKAKSKAKG